MTVFVFVVIVVYVVELS